MSSKCIVFSLILCLINRSPPEAQALTYSHTPIRKSTRRSFFAKVSSCIISSTVLSRVGPSQAREPGSRDVTASLQQIKDAEQTLLQLRRNWDEYAVIDSEGRAGDVDRARRILGGVNPQNLPNPSPLYKIDGAFRVVQNAAIEAESDSTLGRLQVEDFSEAAERLVDDLRKADYQFYGSAFAPGGTRQIRQLYDQAAEFCDRASVEFQVIERLLSEAEKGEIPFREAVVIPAE